MNPVSKAREQSPSMIKTDMLKLVEAQRSKGIGEIAKLTHRYFLNLWFNSGILGTHVAMYSMPELVVGTLFWGLEDRDDFESIQSRTTLLFCCVAFFIFISVALLPFTVM
eukprot:8689747-Ditylum_brightwellii.AAC.1